ncbi:MAG: DUF86 domain-containing protein [Candidatus Nanohaloarchaea archaeon]|nr:DUF86 domain-containing protein [Candidatus Nanohaloarchaea archaeon]
MIDSDVIEQKIDIIQEQLAYLSEVEEDGQEAFTDSFERKQAVKHSLQEAIEACIDIGNHIAAAENLSRGEDLSDIFGSLADAGVVDDDLGARLEEMTKFRNLLIHRYAYVDEDRLWTIATEDINDIPAFVEAVQGYLAESG